jgi:NTE family protein
MRDSTDTASEGATPPEQASQVRTVNLALQGGGSHGAFAWGVLDRLLESGRIDIEGIVGTSAGAMNAAVTAYGLTVGGTDGARAMLRKFWEAVSAKARQSMLQPSWLDGLVKPGSLDFSPGYLMLDMMTRMMSPYQLNPTNMNPLRDALCEVIDFEVLRHSRRVKLYLCASNVMSGRIRVFETKEVSPEAVLASACLPFLFQAVEIDGEHYWDGGYMGNPPIFPLIYNCECRDVLLVMINPIKIKEVPKTAQAIFDRINTLSFNSSLMREMRAIHFVTGLIDHGFDDDGRLQRLYLHAIDAEEEMADLGVSSKLNASWEFVMRLFALGRKHGDRFLDEHYEKIGRESSVDIPTRFL